MVQHIGSNLSSDSSTVPVAAHAVGDLLVVVAWNYDGTTAPTAPSGWTVKHTAAGVTPAVTVAWKRATSTSDGSGSWSGRSDLTSHVYRGAYLGAVASSPTVVPALTLSDPPSWVAVSTVTSPAPATPSGFTSRSSGSYWRISDSNAEVGSFAGGGTGASVVFELADNTVEFTWGQSWGIGGAATFTWGQSWQVQVDTPTFTWAQSWQVREGVELTWGQSWTVESFGTWHEMRLSPRWLTGVADPDITVESWGELVDVEGNVVPIEVDGEVTERLPLDAASVEFHGTQPEQWSASLSFTHPWMVPASSEHPFWGIRNLFVRLWWQLLTADGIEMAMPVCTVAIGNSSGTDDGLISGTVKCRDVLSTMRNGYGAPLDISGMTIDAAIRSVFDRCAPTLPVRIAPSTVVVPANTSLGDDDPLSDVLELAGIGYPDGTVRSDREGVIVAGPRPEPTVPMLDWQEGENCPVEELSWEHGIEHMGNRVTVVSTHADHVGLYVVVEDDDPSSPTYVQGPWGVHPLETVKTEKATTTEGLTNLGRLQLGRGLKPTIDVKVRVPQRPDLEYRHAVRLARELSGVVGVHSVTDWTLVLPVNGEPPEPMEVGMQQRYRT